MALFAAAAHAGTPHQSFIFEPLMAGEPINLEHFKGKAVLIVNTASNCGFTGQYDGLEKLYRDYKDKGLVVIGVPSNDFGEQEPGTLDDIAKFCKFNYGVTFPMTAKYQVKGSNAHPFYKWARQNVGFAGAPKWNFHKYLLNKNGDLVNYFHSTTSPNSTRVIKAIEAALKD